VDSTFGLVLRASEFASTDEIAGRFPGGQLYAGLA
jgi:hypothetical protein